MANSRLFQPAPQMASSSSSSLSTALKIGSGLLLLTDQAKAQMVFIDPWDITIDNSAMSVPLMVSALVIGCAIAIFWQCCCDRHATSERFDIESPDGVESLAPVTRPT